MTVSEPCRGGEPGEAIEVTAEMVAAGMRAISPWIDYDEMVRRIYRAMEGARRRGSAAPTVKSSVGFT